MKTLKKAELTVLILTVLCLVFTAGFFVGRGTSGGVVTIEKLSPADKPSVSASPADEHSPEAVPDDTGTAAADEPASHESATGSYAEPSVPVTAVTEAAGDAEAEGLININTASAAELDALPGIGEVLAGRIIEYREVNGGFKSIEEIMAVSGIGEKKYGDIKDMITVG